MNENEKNQIEEIAQFIKSIDSSMAGGPCSLCNNTHSIDIVDDSRVGRFFSSPCDPDRVLIINNEQDYHLLHFSKNQ